MIGQITCQSNSRRRVLKAWSLDSQYSPFSSLTSRRKEMSLKDGGKVNVFD